MPTSSDSHPTMASTVGEAFLESFRNAARCLPMDRMQPAITDLARRAGELAGAEYAWRASIGECLETTDVVKLLGVSRQALDQRKRAGTILALPGIRTSLYPAWQFTSDADTPQVRPIVSQIIRAFRDEMGEAPPFLVASFATSPQPELSDQTPAQFISDGGDSDLVVLAARRTAHFEI